MKDAQKLLKDRMRRKQTRREKQSRVKNAMASKEYYMESPHLMLARNIFKNSVSKSLPAQMLHKVPCKPPECGTDIASVGGNYDSRRRILRVPSSDQIFATVCKRGRTPGDGTVGKSQATSFSLPNTDPWSYAGYIFLQQHVYYALYILVGLKCIHFVTFTEADPLSQPVFRGFKMVLNKSTTAFFQYHPI